MTRDGVRWTVSVADAVGRDLFVTGHYQANEILAVHRWLESRGGSGRHVVDVGANIGTTSIPFARLGWHVLALEPVPDAVELITANVAANKLEDRVRIVSVAVSATAGTVHMALDGDLGHSEIVRDGGLPGFGNDVQSVVPVRAAPLDIELAEAGLLPEDVALVWSDTQGHESQVLSTGTSLWKAGVPCFVEVWPRGLRSHGPIADFVELATSSFTSFIARDELLRESDPRRVPISDLESLIEATDALPPGRYGRYTDVLLIP